MNKPLSKVLSVFTVFIVLILINIFLIKYYDSFLDLFRLNGVDTVSEYNESSQKDADDWLLRMCNEGKCLHSIDWSCGFTNANDSKVRQCFLDTVSKTQPWVPLDAIRKYCGKINAVSADIHPYGPNAINAESCSDRGGLWRRMTNIPIIPTTR